MAKRVFGILFAKLVNGLTFRTGILGFQSVFDFFQMKAFDSPAVARVGADSIMSASQTSLFGMNAIIMFAIVGIVAEIG